MQEFYLFLMTFVLVFLIYELFVVRKEKKGKSKKKPIEVRFLEARYHLDLKKTNYKQLLNIISLVSAFDIALIVTIIMFAKSFILELLLGATYLSNYLSELSLCRSILPKERNEKRCIILVK